MGRCREFLIVPGLAAVAALPLIAGEPPRPRGDRSEAAQVTVGDQRRPLVDSTASGDFAVVWQGDLAVPVTGEPPQGVFFRAFEERDGVPVSGEILLDSSAQSPVSAVTDDGTALVVWEVLDDDGVGLRGRRCREDSCGAVFPINVTTTGDQKAAAVAAVPGGGHLVVWQSSGQDSDESGAIVGRFFPPAPASPGPEHIVNETPTGEQTEPAVAYSPLTGLFTVVWFGSGGSGSGIAARRFQIGEGPTGLDVPIAATSMGGVALDIQPGGDGQHFVVWTAPDADGTGIFGRRLDATLSQASNVFRVNQIEAGNQDQPAVAADAIEGATFVWVSTEPIPNPLEAPLLGSPIFLKGVKGSGSLGSPFAEGGLPPAHFSFEFEVSSGFEIANPAIGGDPTGNFVVSWQQQGDFDLGAFIRRYGALIFEDDFELGNSSRWSATVP